MSTELVTPRLRLRPPADADVAALAAILAEAEVARFWPGYDARRVREELVANETVRVIVREGEVLGAVQWEEPDDEEYPRAGVDVFLATRAHGQGLGTEALRAVVGHLFGARGCHRVVIDPAADNAKAIRAYDRVGFRAVGLMRKYQRMPDGSFVDGLLMELLAEDFAKARAAERSACAVRAAAEEDVGFLLASMVEFNRGEGIAWEPSAGEAPLRRLLGDPRLGRVLVVCAGEERVGYAVVTYGFDLEFGGPDAFLTELFLDARARRRGMGKAALEAIVRGLAGDGFGALHLQVRADNVAAQRLYRAAGFVGTTRMFFTRVLGR